MVNTNKYAPDLLEYLAFRMRSVEDSVIRVFREHLCIKIRYWHS